MTRTARRTLIASALATAALGAGAGSAAADVHHVENAGVVPEGNAAVFAVRVTHPPGQDYPGFSVGIVPGTADADDVGFWSIDPVPKDEKCFLGACVASILVTVPTKQDAADEPDETFGLRVQPPPGVLFVQPGDGQATIADDDLPAPPAPPVGPVNNPGNPAPPAPPADPGAPPAPPADDEPDIENEVEINLPAGQTPPPAPPAAPTVISNPVQVGGPGGNGQPGNVNVTIANPGQPQGQQASSPQPINGPARPVRTNTEEDELAWPVSVTFKGMTTGARVRLRCDAREELCKGRVLVGLGGGPTLKTARFTLDGGESRSMTIRMSRKLRRKFRRAGQIYFRVVSTDAAGNRAQTTRGFGL